MLKTFLLLLLFAFLISAAAAQAPKSDAVTDGLKGNVKEVLTEQADLKKKSGRLIESNRRNSESISYDLQGKRLTWKTFEYFSGGPMDSVLYGSLDGDKISIFQEVKNSSKIVAIGIPSKGEKLSDPRFTYKLKYKYDEAGNVAEEAWWSNDGSLWLRYTYLHKADQILELVFTGEGKLNQKVVHIFDKRGVETEINYYDVDKDRISEKVLFEYLSFDSEGNWTKRSESAGDRDEKFVVKPRSMQYRTIAYHK